MPRTILDNRYALSHKLGGGGMAEVYLAHDEVLGRDVALKMLRGQYAEDKHFIERFRREARNAASLSHPNIVQIYDQGRAEDGTYYMAMEYVPGGTLKDHIVEQGALDPREAAGIAAQVAEALDVAHERGIVHRDIKPQNVLMMPGTSQGTSPGTSQGALHAETKVADFGIARAASATVVTQTNLVLGTAGYMSPEQASGERVGPASDLYSLGVVLYEMLTGALPYEADTPIAVAMKHVNAPPRRPREANPEVPEELDAVTVALLAKNPEDRYGSARELAEDLRRIRDGLPPVADTVAGVAGVAAGAAGADEATRRETRADAARTRVGPAVAPGRGRGGGASGRRRRGLLTVIAAVLALSLLGAGAWAWSQLGAPDGTGATGGGPGRVEVPGVVDLERDEATRRLEDAGFEVEVETRESAADREGVVLEQSPSGGERAREGATVDLTVGEGPSTVEVPDIPYGATASEAEEMLADAGLELGNQSTQPDNNIPEGGVVAQDPLPGVEVEEGTAVGITLSSEPAPVPEPAAPPATTEQPAPAPVVPEADGSNSGTGGPAPAPEPSNEGPDGGQAPATPGVPADGSEIVDEVQQDLEGD